MHHPFYRSNTHGKSFNRAWHPFTTHLHKVCCTVIQDYFLQPAKAAKSLMTGSWLGPKGDLIWTEDSVGESPTETTESVMPPKSR
jgi:hypothetical protein